MLILCKELHVKNLIIIMKTAIVVCCVVTQEPDTALHGLTSSFIDKLMIIFFLIFVVIQESIKRLHWFGLRL